MLELIQAWTRAGNAVAVYYEKQSGMTGKDVAAAPTTDAPPAEPKPRKPRASKLTEAQADDISGGAPASKPLPPAEPEISDADSLADLYKSVGAFVQKDADEAARAARQKKAKDHLAAEYRVANLKELSIPQRLQFIGWIKEQSK